VERRRVLVVVEDAAAQMPTTQLSSAPIDAYTAFMRAQGCLGKTSREQIDADLAALRDEWDRPLGV
jgi:hypothetical protein